MSVANWSSRVVIRRVLPLAIAGSVACDTAATAPDASLTLNETIAALRALQRVATSPAGASMMTADAWAEATTLDGSAITFATACPGGGTYELTGTLGGWSGPVDAGTSPMYELRERFAGCTVSAEGRSYTFDSDPELLTRSGLRTVDRQSGARSLDGSYTGTFVVTSEGKSARCAVAFTSSLSVDEPVAGPTIRGQLCGRDVNPGESGITLGPVSMIGR